MMRRSPASKTEETTPALDLWISLSLLNDIVIFPLKFHFTFEIFLFLYFSPLLFRRHPLLVVSPLRQSARRYRPRDPFDRRISRRRLGRRGEFVTDRF